MSKALKFGKIGNNFKFQFFSSHPPLIIYCLESRVGSVRVYRVESHESKESESQESIESRVKRLELEV